MNRFNRNDYHFKILIWKQFAISVHDCVVIYLQSLNELKDRSIFLQQTNEINGKSAFKSFAKSYYTEKFMLQNILVMMTAMLVAFCQIDFISNAYPNFLESKVGWTQFIRNYTCSTWNFSKFSKTSFTINIHRVLHRSQDLRAAFGQCKSCDLCHTQWIFIVNRIIELFYLLMSANKFAD